MAEACRHPNSRDIIAMAARLGWSKSSETAKAIRFDQRGFQMNFNGESLIKIAIVLDPILAGSNIVEIINSGATVEDRFSSNFDNFPKKMSPKGKEQYFGVSLKFGDLNAAEDFLKLIQFPELAA